MPSNQYYREQIERELAGAREALRAGNSGRARVCARRAAGQAITWYLTRHPHPAWRADAMHQLLMLEGDQGFPQDVRDAAARLTAKVTGEFGYTPGRDPLGDAQRIISHIVSLMEAPHDR